MITLSIRIFWLSVVLAALFGAGPAAAKTKAVDPLSFFGVKKVYGIDIVTSTNKGCQAYLRIGVENRGYLPLNLSEGNVVLSVEGAGCSTRIGRIVIDALEIPVTGTKTLFKTVVEFIPDGDPSPQQVLELVRSIVENRSDDAFKCAGQGDCYVSVGGLSSKKMRLKMPVSFEMPIRPLDRMASAGEVLMHIEGTRYE